MKTKNILLIFIWIILIAISFFYDREILQFIQLLKNPVFDFVFLGLHYLTDWISILVLFSLYFLIKDKKRLKSFLICYLITMSIVFLLKNSLGRERPSGYEGEELYNSFPSGHSAAVFSALNFVSEKYIRYWALISILVIISRVYLGFHYMSDALAGAFIGYSFSRIFLRLEFIIHENSRK
ncbi:phosphatase PAP2 family protein [Candidatus Woesearchaeota archaeon]|nr:phosphatase PAP2 family protein [Candidatus Woesearchaeota archaeon]